MQKSADPDANIIVGAVIDENLKDEMLITVIATGFEKGPVLKKIEKPMEKSQMSARSEAGIRHQTPAVETGVSDELEIPTFLRKNRFK